MVWCEPLNTQALTKDQLTLKLSVLFPAWSGEYWVNERDGLTVHKTCTPACCVQFSSRLHNPPKYLHYIRRWIYYLQTSHAYQFTPRIIWCLIGKVCIFLSQISDPSHLYVNWRTEQSLSHCLQPSQLSLSQRSYFTNNFAFCLWRNKKKHLLILRRRHSGWKLRKHHRLTSTDCCCIWQGWCLGSEQRCKIYRFGSHEINYTVYVHYTYDIWFLWFYVDYAELIIEKYHSSQWMFYNYSF